MTGLGYFRFSYEVHDGVAVQLYKLVEGTIESSKAFQLARVEGIEDKTVERWKIQIKSQICLELI